MLKNANPVLVVVVYRLKLDGTPFLSQYGAYLDEDPKVASEMVTRGIKYGGLAYAQIYYPETKTMGDIYTTMTYDGSEVNHLNLDSCHKNAAFLLDIIGTGLQAVSLFKLTKPEN